MLKLEDLKPGLPLEGLEPSIVTMVAAVVPVGGGAVQVFYRTPEDETKERLLGRGDERRKIKAMFRSDPEVRVLIATDAAGEGISLQNADLMVNYDLPWNRNQAEPQFGWIHLPVNSPSDRTFKVIDGQQRLATLSIIALVVIDRLRQLARDGIDANENSERADALRSLFIGSKDPASLTVTSKLTLNETDDGFYQDFLVAIRSPPNPRRMPKSNQLLWKCFQWYQKQLKQLAAVSNDGSRYSMAQKIAELEPEKWGAPQIDNRQQQMAKQAAHLWRSDFA